MLWSVCCVQKNCSLFCLFLLTFNLDIVICLIFSEEILNECLISSEELPTNGKRRGKRKFYEELKEEDDLVPDLPICEEPNQFQLNRTSRCHSVEGLFSLCFFFVYNRIPSVMQCLCGWSNLTESIDFLSIVSAKHNLGFKLGLENEFGYHNFCCCNTLCIAWCMLYSETRVCNHNQFGWNLWSQWYQKLLTNWGRGNRQCFKLNLSD